METVTIYLLEEYTGSSNSVQKHVIAMSLDKAALVKLTKELSLERHRIIQRTLAKDRVKYL